MTDRSPVSRLGVYMRHVGENLHATEPMTAEVAYEKMVAGYSVDVGYAMATLMRLEERGIATKVEGGFVRGPNWDRANVYYGWKD